MAGFTSLAVKNYRCLADVEFELRPINVFFGPNGAGKTTLLDAIWFFRDCAIRGTESASSPRSHGIGTLWDGAQGQPTIEISIESDSRRFTLRFGFSDGRIEKYPGEVLSNTETHEVLIERRIGDSQAQMFHPLLTQRLGVPLREPDKLSLGLYLDLHRAGQPDNDSESLDRLLHFVRHYHSRSFFVFQLRQRGSDSGTEVRLFDRGENLWSVLRNLEGRRHSDTRFETIIRYMQRAFPGFDAIVLEATGAEGVYCSFLEKGRRSEIRASGVSDGYLQMLLLLTALFSEGDWRPAVILFDEPEISLHPWGQVVFAEAVREAVTTWQKQVLLATHSPVLLNAFDPADIIEVAREVSPELGIGPSQFRRLTEIQEVRDLLEQYGAGSLYMSQMVAEQSTEPMVRLETRSE